MVLSSNPKIIIITGTPGVGKTSICKILYNMGYSVINLNEIILQYGLYYGYDFSRDSVIIDEEFVLSKLTNLLSSYSNIIFIEGHTTELLPKEFIEIIFIIRCNPKELRSRLLSRGYSEAKIKENIQAEIMDECKNLIIENYPNKKIIEIDSTNNSLEIIVNQILKEYENMF